MSQMYKVVIVEDEEIIRKGLMFTVHWTDLECTVVADCGNGEEGVKAIQEFRPDIVITDINMPVVDGLEMIRRTCEEYEYAAVILSGYSDFEYAQTAIRYGVLGYLLKPLKTSEIIEAIEKAKKECEKRNIFRSHREKPEKLTKNFLEEFHSGYTGNDELIQQMLLFIKENYGQKIVMNDLEKRFNYSSTFLNKKFKEAMGTTFMEYVNRYRVRQAIDMMTNQRMPLQKVAWECGIGEYKYFSTVFKKYLGCSPKEYLADMGLWMEQ